MALILDTSFVIEAERESRRGGGGRIEDFLTRNADEEFFLTFTVAGELACGTSAASRKKWERLLKPYFVLKWEREITFLYGEIYRDLAAKGSLIGTNDLWIAAAAVHYRMGVVTRTADEFSRVPGLSVTLF